MLTLGAQAPAQQPELSKPLHGMPLRESPTLVDPDNKLRNLVSRILSQYGLKLDDGQWVIGYVDDRTPIPNADSGIDSEGKRYIRFNKSFMERLSQAPDGNWLVYAIAAHEIGHHLGNHSLRPFFPRQLQEREADYQTGFVLARLGAGYKETTSLVRWVPMGPSLATDDYPPRSQRLCEIGRGWRDGARKNLFQIDAAEDKVRRAVLCTGQEPDPKRFALRVGHDIYGHDIKLEDADTHGVRGLDLAGCAMLCERLHNCKAFSFDRWFGICFPKDEIVASIVDPPSVIGVKSPQALPPPNTTAKTRMLLADKRRFYDTPIAAPTPSASVADCRQQCRNHERCYVYTFLVAQKQCLMYDETAKEGPYIHETALTGYKQQEQRTD
jgi:hypothetical protein